MADPAKPTTEGDRSVVLPAAKEVIARFVKELGGKEKLDAITSQYMTGKVEMIGQGISGKVEVFAKRPNKFLMRILIPGIGNMDQGYDGKVAWVNSAVTGPMLLEGKMAEQVKQQADFEALLHNQSDFKSMTNAGRALFEGANAYRLILVRNSGQEVTEYYDIDNGLLIGTSEQEETPLGAVQVNASVGGYQRYGGMLFATKLKQTMGPMAQSLTFDTMELNKVDDAVFALPDAIKALLKPKEAAPANP